MLLAAWCNRKGDVCVKAFSEFKDRVTRATFNGMPYCLFLRKDITIERYVAVYNKTTINVLVEPSEETLIRCRRDGFTIKDITKITYPFISIPNRNTYAGVAKYDPSITYSYEEAIRIAAETMMFLNAMNNMLRDELSRISSL